MRFSAPLKLNHIFHRLYHKGDVCVGRFVVLYTRPNGSRFNRVGITTGKKLGHAVVRNRARRRLREIYRLNEERFVPGRDLVVVVRNAATTASFSALQADYLRAAKKLGILREEP